MKVLAQLDTTRALCPFLLLLCGLWGAGCEHPSQREPQPITDGGPDAEVDASDAEVDAATDHCELDRTREQEFLKTHRACESHDDCVIVGDCSNSDFLAVNRASEPETQKLVNARSCQAKDGPGYYAVCIAGMCQRAASVLACGGPIVNTCPTGLAWYEPGCGGTDFAADCYAKCSLDQPNTCGEGYACKQVEIDPCGGGTGDNASCDACGAQVALCMPAPDCQVMLETELDNQKAVALGQDGATQLSLSVRNVTDAEVTIRYDEPCFGPVVSGLGNYNVWDACVTAECPKVSQTSLTIPARQSRNLQDALISIGGSRCNRQPIASGSYHLGFGLTGLTGAKVCNGVPAQLTVSSGTSASL